MMKKSFSLLLATAMLLVGTTALASEAGTTASGGISFTGKIEYQQALSLTAPFGGQLEDYQVQAGDTVAQDEPLFTIRTTKVYAAADGVVRGVRAVPGDDAQSVVDRYGALAYIEPEGQFVVTATTSGAYKSSDNGNVNRLLHEGETVYLRSVSNNDRVGTGFITAIDGSSYTVEVTESNLQIEEKVNLYREASYASESRIGTSGSVKKNDSIAVLAEGSILHCYVQDGDAVQRGDLLFETVTGTLDDLQERGDEVTAPVDGVLIEVNQAAGTTVSKGDVLATLYDQNALLVRADISESDLDYVQEGDRVRITFDVVSRDSIEGVVESISSISTSESGDAVYTATISLPSTEGLRVGMNVSVYTQ